MLVVHCVVLEGQVHALLSLNPMVVCTPFLTGTGGTTIVMMGYEQLLLLSGVGLSMHSVATYSHTYMGYEAYT